MWPTFVVKGKHKPKKAAAGGEGQGTLQASRQVYEAVKGQYHIHDRANEHLEKKAQNCMVASALVATLLVTTAVAHEAGSLVWGSYVSYIVIAPVTGLLLTIIFCIVVNKTSPHPVPIMGDSLLCRDELDEKMYARLVKSEEDFYKLSIAEYARALVTMEATNKEKAENLKAAYIIFAASITLTLIGVVTAILL